MKSICNESLAHCPNGCEPFDVEYWSLVRADQEPDLKQAALGGELNLVRCPTCGMFFHHGQDLIYLDAQNELLVFVFSHETKQKEPDLQARITRDYEITKNTLLKELHMQYPPLTVFGLEELKEVLQGIEQAEAESEVIAAAAAVAGFAIARLKPSYARQHHFPFYVPAPASADTANDYAVAAAKVLKNSLNSPLLLHFKDKMTQPDALKPELL